MTVPFTPPVFVPVGQLLINIVQPGFSSEGPIRFGTHDGPIDWGIQTQNAWVSVDLAPYGVPSNAIAVFLTGLLIITGGQTSETAEMEMRFRASGDPAASSAQISLQAIIVTGQPQGVGIRCPAALWIPLNDGKFDYWLSTNSAGDWPTHSAYGFNSWIGAVAMP